MIDVIYMLLQWTLILLIRIPLILLGLLAVLLALPFSKIHPATYSFFTKYNKEKQWVLETLPKWAWIWSNDRDGARGDRRGWWDAHSQWGDSSSFMSKFWWLAIRNPVNNMRFVRGISCNVKESIVVKLAGQDDVDDKVGKTGFQWLKAKGKKYNYYHLYWVKPNKKDPTKAFIIRMGHKIKLGHNNVDWSKEDQQKQWKGFTFRIGWNKDIS